MNDDLQERGVGPPLQGSRFVYYNEKETFEGKYWNVLLDPDNFFRIYLRSLLYKRR